MIDGNVTIFWPIGTLITSIGKDCFLETSGSTGNFTVMLDGMALMPLGTSNGTSTVVVSVKSPKIIGLVEME